MVRHTLNHTPPPAHSPASYASDNHNSYKDKAGDKGMVRRIMKISA